MKKILKKLFRNRKRVIGRLEKVNIPKLGLYEVDAKIDTGAYRGTIHAGNIREVEKKGKKYIEFNVLDENYNPFHNKLHRISKYKMVKVRSSQSPYDDRYAIRVKVELAGETFSTYLSLSDRTELRYPILIGRKSLKNKFLVDVSREYIN